MKGFFDEPKKKKQKVTVRDYSRLLICGDRQWKDFAMIRETLEAIGTENIKLVIEGGATGADYLAGTAARILGVKVLTFPANWTKYDRAAGPIRNRQMLKEGKPTLVIAFHDNLKKSKGTKDMLAAADKAGVPTIHLSHKSPNL